MQPDIGRFVDLDNDGHQELLFLAVSTDEYKRSFYCFNADGSVRFSVVPGRTIAHPVRFGDRTFGPPFAVLQFFVIEDPPRQKAVLVISYDPTWFPAVVQKYSASGQLLGEYWSAGRLYDVALAHFGSRRFLMVGGTNNEFHGGSLAVLDWDNPSGFGPASNPHYQCRRFPSGSRSPSSCFRKRMSHGLWRLAHCLANPSGYAGSGMFPDYSKRVNPSSAAAHPDSLGQPSYCFDQQMSLRSAEMMRRVSRGSHYPRVAASL